MQIELTIEQISLVVSQELRRLHAEILADSEFDCGDLATRSQWLQGLRALIEYYSVPEDFDNWRNSHES